MVAGGSEVSGPVGGGACDGVQCPHHDICHVVDQSPRCICRARCHDNDNDDNFFVVVRQSRRRRSSDFVTHRGHVEERSVTCALVDAAENKFRRGDFSTRRAGNAVDWSTWMCCCNNDDDDEENNDNKNDDTSDNNEKNDENDQGPDLQNILRQSYDYLTTMPKLRSTYDGRLIYKTSYEERKAFLMCNSLAKS